MIGEQEEIQYLILLDILIKVLLQLNYHRKQKINKKLLNLYQIIIWNVILIFRKRLLVQNQQKIDASMIGDNSMILNGFIFYFSYKKYVIYVILQPIRQMKDIRFRSSRNIYSKFFQLKCKLLLQLKTSNIQQTSIVMKQTTVSKQNNTAQQSKSIPKSTLQKNVSTTKKGQKANNKTAPIAKYKIDAITKQNFDISGKKQNITEIGQLQLKYVLKCIQGLYKNRFLFITTHPDGEIFGSGDAKLYSLTLQIQGVGLASKHAQLRYDGFKSFNVRDFGSQAGTWMNIPDEGVQIQHGDQYSVGPYLVGFQLCDRIDQIQEICAVYHIHYMSDILRYNEIKTMADLYKAQYNNFNGYPFDNKQIQKLKKICQQSKNWFQQSKKYKKLSMYFLNQPLKDFSMEIGWQTLHIVSDPELIFTGKNPVADVAKGKLIPHQKVFAKIKEGKQFPLSLHSQIKIGDLAFQMTRFNSGSGIDIGFRNLQQDGLIIEQDIGGSQWKLISLFAVFDGHGGPECMKFMCQNLVPKIRQWTHLLDEAGDINQMTKLLMNKTFYQLDYQFYKTNPDLAQTCGATGIVILIIQKRAYCFHIGDCKGYLFRKDTLYQLNIDHIPSRGDQRLRIQNAGGFIQYDRLMGKCTLSRCLGQFQYKSPQDYQNQFKGKLKSFLSCIPEVIGFDIQVQTDQFMLISTDGIFGGMNIHQITDFIMQRYDKLQTEQNPNKIISSIMENCKIVNPQCDNMAVILIIIRKGQVK